MKVRSYILAFGLGLALLTGASAAAQEPPTLPCARVDSGNLVASGTSTVNGESVSHVDADVLIVSATSALKQGATFPPPAWYAEAMTQTSAWTIGLPGALEFIPRVDSDGSAHALTTTTSRTAIAEGWANAPTQWEVRANPNHPECVRGRGLGHMNLIAVMPVGGCRNRVGLSGRIGNSWMSIQGQPQTGWLVTGQLETPDGVEQFFEWWPPSDTINVEFVCWIDAGIGDRLALQSGIYADPIVPFGTELISDAQVLSAFSWFKLDGYAE